MTASFDMDDVFDDGSSTPVLPPAPTKARKTKTPVEEPTEDDSVSVNVHTGEEIDGKEKPLAEFVHAFLCTKKGCKGRRSTDEYDPEKETLCPFCGSPMSRHYWTKGGRRMRTENAA